MIDLDKKMREAVETVKARILALPHSQYPGVYASLYDSILSLAQVMDDGVPQAHAEMLYDGLPLHEFMEIYTACCVLLGVIEKSELESY